MSLDLEFPGRNATWVFGTDGLRIDYAQGFFDSTLLRALRSRHVPWAAVSDVTVSGGGGAPVIALALAPGSDPLTEIARGRLEEHEEPYRLVLDADRADLARHHRDRILAEAAAAREAVGGVPPGLLLDAPTPPQRLTGLDGEAALTADAIRITWHPDAETPKLRAGDRTFPLGTVRGVEWERPGVLSGGLRVLTDRPSRPGTRPEDDPDVLAFGLGYGAIADTLPFAMAVLVAADAAGGLAGAPGPGGAGGEGDRGDDGGDDVEHRLRTLARLRDEGLLEPAEYDAKKQELLARL